MGLDALQRSHWRALTSVFIVAVLVNYVKEAVPMATRLIRELAAELGLNPHTLRYYEARRVLPPPARTVSGYRVYDEDTVVKRY